MTVIIIIVVVAFLWWSLVPPSKPREPNLNDLINSAQRRDGNYSNVYKKKLAGSDFYYVGKSPENPNDKVVFTGTDNECSYYANKYDNY
ncbi:MAG: hypothetical protein APF83_01200 [Lutibacter sp. BRH_c52]|nr:MAG: hypothetical protein APF83_01200 [Lutibacter sp. BRH_c52]HCE53845.1 hypothetical protein [Lutibacter sp.]